MSDPLPLPRRMTFDEYLAFEESVETRHEYIDGVVYAMSGGLSPHNLIAMNAAALLWIAATGGSCRVYQQGQKLRVGNDVFYPDVMAVGAPDSGDDRLEIAPCLLVEVLSRSTRRLDRTKKLERYRTLPSLRAYLMVYQTERRVERHWRDAADAPWHEEERTPADGDVPVPCPVATTLAWDQLYRGVRFPERPPIRRVREGVGPDWGTSVSDPDDAPEWAPLAESGT